MPRLPPAVQETLDAFVARLRERFGARLVDIRLFGSYARGEAHEESDVDCLVLLDSVAPADDREVTDLSADLIWQIGGVVISPLIMSVADFEAWKASERRTRSRSSVKASGYDRRRVSRNPRRLRISNRGGDPA